MSGGLDIPPQVFFSYSYRESKQLKPIFRKACEQTGLLPIFADEIFQVGDTIFQKLQILILSCDLVIVVITQPISAGVLWEITHSQMISKPVLLFIKQTVIQKTGIPFDFRGFHYIEYKTNNELFQSISSTLLKFRPGLERSEFIQIKKDENKIIGILRKSLEKNILVLGKDSDEEGLVKISRIADVLRKRGYKPVMLKKLPEIQYLSLEGKMIRVGGLCRFVIAEDSRPSGHIDEIRLCATCQYITATIREVGTASTWMQAHYPQYFNFMNRFCYRNSKDVTAIRDSLCQNIYDSLEIATNEAILWAETRIRDRERYFKRKIYSNF